MKKIILQSIVLLLWVGNVFASAGESLVEMQAELTKEFDRELYERIIVYRNESGVYGFDIVGDKSLVIHKAGKQVYASLGIPVSKNDQHFLLHVTVKESQICVIKSILIDGNTLGLEDLSIANGVAIEQVNYQEPIIKLSDVETEDIEAKIDTSCATNLNNKKPLQRKKSRNALKNSTKFMLPYVIGATTIGFVLPMMYKFFIKNHTKGKNAPVDEQSNISKA